MALISGTTVFFWEMVTTSEQKSTYKPPVSRIPNTEAVQVFNVPFMYENQLLAKKENNILVIMNTPTSYTKGFTVLI